MVPNLYIKSIAHGIVFLICSHILTTLPEISSLFVGIFINLAYKLVNCSRLVIENNAAHPGIRQGWHFSLI
jgi:hypothetical protein